MSTARPGRNRARATDRAATAGSGFSGRYFAVLTAAALATAFAAYTLTSRGTDAPAIEPPVATPTPAAAPGTGADEPESPATEALVFAPPNLVTGPGIAQFVAEYRERFGDTVADKVWLHPDHGDIERAVAGQPNRLVSFDYRGGFDQSADPTTRPVDTATVDLAALDIDAIGRVLAEAPAAVRVPDGAVTHLSYEADNFPPYEGVPAVSIYVSNSFDESGWLLVGPTGDILRVWPFEG